MTRNGWSVYFCTTPELKPFFLLKDELPVEQGCLMWSLHTVIRTSLQEHILSEITKGTPRNCTHEVSYPQSCLVALNRQQCQGESKQCLKSTSSTNFPLVVAYNSMAVHANQSKYYLIIVDAHS